MLARSLLIIYYIITVIDSVLYYACGFVRPYSRIAHGIQLSLECTYLINYTERSAAAAYERTCSI